MEIKIYKYPKDTKDLLIRDFDPNLIGEAVSAISDIINDIEENGDTALLKYERLPINRVAEGDGAGV